MPPTPLIKMVLKLGLSSSFDPAAAADALRVKRDFDAQIKELLAGLSLAGLRYLVINNMPAPPRSAPAPGVTPATARHHRGPEPVAAVGAPAGLGVGLRLPNLPHRPLFRKQPPAQPGTIGDGFCRLLAQGLGAPVLQRPVPAPRGDWSRPPGRTAREKAADQGAAAGLAMDRSPT